MEKCIESVNTALVVCQTNVSDELRGIWCDALIHLIHQQWPISRQVGVFPIPFVSA